MKKKTKPDEVAPTCSIDYAFRRIGSKYKGRILMYLYQQEIMRYGVLRRHMSDITPKMLTQTLKELEEDDLIHREAFKEIPPRVEYSLTHMGHQLIPFIILLRDWGKEKMEIRGMIPIPPKDCVPPKESALALVM